MQGHVALKGPCREMPYRRGFISHACIVCLVSCSKRLALFLTHWPTYFPPSGQSWKGRGNSWLTGESSCSPAGVLIERCKYSADILLTTLGGCRTWSKPACNRSRPTENKIGQDPKSNRSDSFRNLHRGFRVRPVPAGPSYFQRLPCGVFRTPSG